MNIVKLPVKESLNAKQAFREARKEKFKDVIIMGYTADDEITYVVSRMISTDALWLVERIKKIMFEGKV